MIKVYSLLLFFFIAGLVSGQIQKPKSSGNKPASPKTSRPSQIAGTKEDAIINVTWESWGNVMIKIDNKEITLSKGSTNELHLPTGKALTITVRRPGKEFIASNYLILEPGKENSKSTLLVIE